MHSDGNDSNKLSSQYNLAKQLFNNKTMIIQGMIDANGRINVSFPLHVVPGTYHVSSILIPYVTNLTSGFTAERYDDGLLVSGLSGYKNYSCDVHVLLTY